MLVEAYRLEKLPNSDPHSIVAFNKLWRQSPTILWEGWFFTMKNGDTSHFAISLSDYCCEIVTFRTWNAPQNWKNETIQSFERIIDDNFAEKMFQWKPKHEDRRTNYMMIKLHIKDLDNPCWLFISNTHSGWCSQIVELRTPTHYEFAFL